MKINKAKILIKIKAKKLIKIKAKKLIKIKVKKLIKIKAKKLKLNKFLIYLIQIKKMIKKKLIIFQIINLQQKIN